MVAEVRALLDGMVMLINSQYCNFPLVLELDSLLLVNIIKGIVMPPWSVWYYMLQIQKKLSNFQYSIHHIYREGN